MEEGLGYLRCPTSTSVLRRLCLKWRGGSVIHDVLVERIIINYVSPNGRNTTPEGHINE